MRTWWQKLWQPRGTQKPQSKRTSKIRPVYHWRPTVELLENRIAPAGSISGAALAAQGNAYVLTLSSGGDPNLTGYTINWGDGSALQTVITTAATAYTDHIYAAGPNTYSISATLNDPTPQTLNTLSVGVQNLPPTINTALDSSFGSAGSNGLVMTDPSGLNVINQFVTMFQQASGRIVQVGSSQLAGGTTVGLAGYTSNGALDPTFGPNGTGLTATPISGLSSFTVHAAVVDPNGNIIVGGTANNDFVLVRYTPNGVLDTTFGGGQGYVALAGPGGDHLNLSAVALDGNGNIIVSGITSSGTPNRDIALARFNISTGTFDTTFGTNGVAISDYGTGILTAAGLTVDANDNILVAGSITNTSAPGGTNAFLARFTSTGAKDTTFNGTGYQAISSFPGTTPTPATALANSFAQVIVLGNGTIIAVGTAGTNDNNGNVGVASFNSSGGVNLVESFDFSGARDFANNIVPLANGNFLLLCTTTPAPNSLVNNFGLLELNSSLALNTSFGSGGQMVVSFPGVKGGATAALVESDGSLVVGGSVSGYLSGVVTQTLPGVPVYQYGLAHILTAPPTASEGSTLSQNESFLDPGTETYSATVNYGDGGSTQPLTLNANNTFSLNHAYQTPGTYTATITISNSGGGSTTVTQQVVVNYVAPTLSISGNSTVSEGSLYTLNLSATDPGTTSIQYWTINWGDGTTSNTTASPAPSAFYHVYTTSGTYTITATATDTVGTYAAGNTVGLTVNASAPTNVNIAGGPYTINEGQSLTLNAQATTSLFNSNGFSAYSPGQLIGQNGFTGSGANAASLFIVSPTAGTNGGQGVQALSGNSSVAYAVQTFDYTPQTGQDISIDVDIARTASSTTNYLQFSPIYAVEVDNPSGGRTARFGLYADLTNALDPGAITAFVSIPVPTSVNSTGNMVLPLGGIVAPGEFVHFHAVLNYATQTMTLTIDGITYGPFSFVKAATVFGAASLQVGSFPQSTDTGYFDNFNVNLLSSPSNPSNSAFTYSWDVNGDGTYGDATGANPTLTWAQLQALGITAPGTWNVSVQVNDGLGDVVNSTPVTLTVLYVAPTLSISGNSTDPDGSPYTLDLSATDPGTDVINYWTINWGDGSTPQVVNGNPSSAMHVYTKPGNFTISATATDSTQTTTAGNTVGVNVQYVAPTLSIGGNGLVNEGTPYTLNLSGTGGDSANISSWTINWGDGTTPQVVSGNPTSVTHLYVTPGTYTISASATDSTATNAAGNTLTIGVQNVAPQPYLALDPGFGTNGEIENDIGNANNQVQRLYTLANGNILATGSVTGGAVSVNEYTSTGSPVSTFGSNGQIVILPSQFSIGGNTATALSGGAVALMPDGGFVLGVTATVNGSTYQLLARYTAAGVLDTSDGFGITSPGYTLIQADGNADTANDIVRDGSGNFVVVGESGSGSTGKGLVALFNSSGSLLSSVTQTMPPTQTYDGFNRVALQSNGGIIVYGGTNLASGTYENILWRFTNTSNVLALDSTFGTNGYVNFGLANGNVLSGGLVILANNDILVGVQWFHGALNFSGTVQRDFGLAEFTPTGQFNTGFGNGGIVDTVITGYDAEYGVAVEPNGTIVLAGYTYSGANGHRNFTVAEYNSNGTLNTAFGTNGVAMADFPGLSNGAIAVTLAANGEIILGGYAASTTGNGSDEGLAEFLVPGTEVTLAEGGASTQNGNFSDPGVNDGPWTLTVNYGDGSSTQPLSINPNDNGDQYTLNHQYTTPGTYTVTVTVTDKYGATGTATEQVDVTYVAPTVSISGSSTATEGSPYTLDLSSSDPGSVSIGQWTINWGDGDVQQVTGNPAAVTHDYTTAGSYTISASATDSVSTYMTNTVAVNVPYVAPTISIGGNGSVNEGTPYILNLSATGGNSAHITSWTINWGDGSAPQVVSGNPSVVTHVYTDGPNTWTISATATDSQGSHAAGNTLTVGIVNVAPQPYLALDPTFGTNGEVTNDIGNANNQVQRLYTLANGNILATGSVTGGAVSVNEYTSTGSPVTTFGSNGQIVILPSQFSIGGNTATALSGGAVALMPDGGFVLGVTATVNGSTYQLLARYTAAGVLDTTDGFGITSPGYTLIQADGNADTANDIVRDGSGNFVVVGESGSGSTAKGLVALFNSSGSLLSSVTQAMPATQTYDGFNRVALQSNGGIIVYGGTNLASGTYENILWRFTNTSNVLALDSTFGTNGYVNFGLTNGNVLSGGLVILANNDILVGVQWFYGALNFSGTVQRDFGLAEFTPTGQFNTGFGNNGEVDTVITGYDAEYGVAVEPDGTIVLAGYTYSGTNGHRNFTVAEYTSTGLLNSAFGTNGVAMADFPGLSNGAIAVTLAANGEIILGGYAASTTGNGSDEGLAEFLVPGTAVTLTQGSTFVQGGNFSDPGVNDGPWTLTVNYGDGSGVQPLSINANDNGDQYTLNHQYTTPGVYTVTVTVTDKYGVTGTATELVIITGPTPTPTPPVVVPTPGAGSTPITTPAPTPTPTPTPAPAPTSPTTTQAATYFAVGSSNSGWIGIYDTSGNFKGFISFDLLGASAPGGVRVALGDVNDDGIPDLIVTLGPGSAIGATVEVFDGKQIEANLNNFGGLLGLMPTSFFWPYAGHIVPDAGLYLATGNVGGNGNGIGLVIGSDDPRLPAEVFIYNHTDLMKTIATAGIGTAATQYLTPLYPSGVGARVALGDIDGSGDPSIIVSPGALPSGMLPIVEIYRTTGNPSNPVNETLLDTVVNGQLFIYSLPSLMLYAPDTTGVNGAFVTAGDFNGDGKADIVVSDGSLDVADVYSGAQLAGQSGFFTGSPTELFAPIPGGTTGGVHVGQTVAVLTDGKEGWELLTIAGGKTLAPLDGYDLSNLSNPQLTLTSAFFSGGFLS